MDCRAREIVLTTNKDYSAALRQAMLENPERGEAYSGLAIRRDHASSPSVLMAPSSCACVRENGSLDTAKALRLCNEFSDGDLAGACKEPFEALVATELSNTGTAGSDAGTLQMIRDRVKTKHGNLAAAAEGGRAR